MSRLPAGLREIRETGAPEVVKIAFITIVVGIVPPRFFPRLHRPILIVDSASKMAEVHMPTLCREMLIGVVLALTGVIDVQAATEPSTVAPGGGKSPVTGGRPDEQKPQLGFRQLRDRRARTPPT